MDERDRLIRDIKHSGARIVFVGLGCPRQEVFVYEFAKELSMPMLAVGAAFAFHAGSVSQAPQWMQRRGLEWLYRMTREPGRLWRRYAVLNPVYVFLIALQWLKLHRPDAGDAFEPHGKRLYG